MVVSTKTGYNQAMAIAVKYCRGIVIVPSNEKNEIAAASMNADIMQLGFVMTRGLYEAISTLSIEDIASVHEGLVNVLRKIVGADVVYAPMYPNFPEQVMEASNFELYLNAIMHYWSFGQWKPDYEKTPREFAFENVKFKEIDLVTEEDFKNIFTRLVESNDSISATDKKTVEWFIDNHDELKYPESIPFKENLCLVASILFERGKDVTGLARTATDILRIATHLSNGDISLADKTKFKSFSRKTRRFLVNGLEKVVREEDIERYRSKWVRLFHNLHIGEYAKTHPKSCAVADKIRSNTKIVTYNSRVQSAVDKKDIGEAVKLLSQRPGEFTRRIDHLLRISTRKKSFIIDEYLKVASDVPTRVLLQLLGNLKIRNVDTSFRVAFPKGSTQKAVALNQELPKHSASVIRKLSNGIRAILSSRFSSQGELGKVWIDPDLMDCPVPSQQRSASEGLFQVARGTALPFGDETKSTLRFFVYWVGNDIDLSATLHDDSFNMIEQISYTNLKSDGYEACHSGDIISAPKGASEFIDITIDKAVERGARYVTMNVLVYSGPAFKDHKSVYAGWMTRSKPKSNEVYDPKTVEQKIDLTSESKRCTPVAFDLVNRKAIWIDVNGRSNCHYGGNNIHSNRASIEQTLEAMVNMANKVSLYELFELHAKNRGEIVESREDADYVFSIYDGDVTPYNIDVINSEFMA